MRKSRTGLTAALAVLLLMALTACGGTGQSADNQSAATGQPPTATAAAACEPDHREPAPTAQIPDSASLPIQPSALAAILGTTVVDMAVITDVYMLGSTVSQFTYTAIKNGCRSDKANRVVLIHHATEDPDNYWDSSLETIGESAQTITVNGIQVHASADSKMAAFRLKDGTAISVNIMTTNDPGASTDEEMRAIITSITS